MGNEINDHPHVSSIVLGRKTIEVIKDTGAQVSLIGRNIVKELIQENPELELAKCKKKLKCANDTHINCDEQLQGHVTYKGVDLGIHTLYLTEPTFDYPILAGGKLLKSILEIDGNRIDKVPESHNKDYITNSKENGIANSDKDGAKVDYVKSTNPTQQNIT